ncbi:MAG: lamin tail domain-containing protein [Candidatus Zixiibacteriota bacterium]|nr:MAG: lamin tail domain-containing protein [candidate division Zixibacteria bacterium]
MVGGKYRILTSCIIFFLAYFGARADIVLNEVMSNEPGGSVTLEWIELYNDTDVPANLALHTLTIDGTTLVLPSEGFGPYQYAVLCRKMFTEGTTPGFESVWGDSSGVWGDDTTLENYTLVEVPEIRLTNDSGVIICRRLQYQISIFKWTAAGLDGVSWERLLLFDSLVGNSEDPQGSTPGELNSITPVPEDLALLPVQTWPEGSGVTGLEITLANVGLEVVTAGNLSVYYDNDENGIVEASDLIAIIPFPETVPTDTFSITVFFELEGVYPVILVKLPSDDRPLNNQQSVRSYGNDYPPLILSEFIAKPEFDLDAEWVELKNRSGIETALKSWYLGDELTMRPITAGDFIVTPGEYILLTDDSAVFAAYYDPIDFAVFELSSWPRLNDKDDLIRLTDDLGFAADSVRYEFVFGGNYSWGRSEEAGMGDRWGRSTEVGGTPGRPNEIYYQPSASEITVTVEPNPFSPSRGEEATISFKVPPGDNITVKVYDTQGRLVRTVLDDLPPFDGSISWDGRTDAGRRLNVGVYILYIEVSGEDAYKQTIVIAP